MTIIQTSEIVQNHGEVFTRRWVVETLLDLTGYTADRDLGSLRLIEPSCGSGAFLGVIVERLIASAASHDRELSALGNAIRAYELQHEHVGTCRALCVALLTGAGMAEEDASKLAATWVLHADFLLPAVGTVLELTPDEVSGPEDQTADVVVGNPPYIRYDDLSDSVATIYRRTWATMTGRGDIYVGFFERSLSMLKPNGKVGFICADRWMRNSYGAQLRALVSSRYAMEHVWTMHDVDAFETQVSAYPAITVLSNAPQGGVVVADTSDKFGADSARALVQSSKDTAWFEFSDRGVRAHRLPSWFEGDELWPTGSPARLALIEHLNQNFHPIHNVATGTKVSIGIATGADRVYVTKDPTVAEADRMLPLAMRRDLMSGTFDWQGNYLVNPWDSDGKLVSLADYPRMRAYLNADEALRGRFVAKKDPASWYRTIDKVQPGLTERPKLLIQDMKTTIHPVLDAGGHYPHHNLYYVISDSWDLEVLGGLLLSRVAQAFIEAYCVRMRGGTLRFQAQYLKRIRVPDPTQMAASTREALRAAFRSRDVEAATASACSAYGIDPNEYELIDEGTTL